MLGHTISTALQHIFLKISMVVFVDLIDEKLHNFLKRVVYMATGSFCEVYCTHTLFCLVPKRSKNFFAQYPSYRIFGRIHGALNVGKKIINCTVCL
jgi:hypothetical protein